MKKHVFFHRLLICIISIAMILSLTSCAQQKKPIPQPAKNEEEQNKPPKELDDLSKAVEGVEKTLFEMYERNKKPLFIQQEEIKKQQEKEQKQGEKQGGGGSESGGGGEGGQQGGGEGGGEKQGGGQQTTQVELMTPQAQQQQLQLQIQQMQIEVDKANQTQFEQLKKDVLELHGLWNAFEAKAVSQFVMQSSIVDFEDALNALTKSIDGNQVFQSLLDVTQLFKYLPDFYLAYSTDYPPEIDKVRFAAKKIQLLGEKENYDAAKETTNYLSGIWMLARPKLNKESMDMINQFEFAVSDLTKAIEEKNNTIVKAKTEVIIKVSDELEKANSKKEQKK